jgi:hypothetical protein
MPAKITTVWLTTGGALVLALLVLGALLPRPNAEYSLFDSLRRQFSSEEQQASKASPPADDAGKDKDSVSKKTDDAKQGEGAKEKDKQKAPGDNKDKGNKDKDGEKKGDAKEGDKKDAQPAETQPESSPPMTQLKDALEKLGKWFKWIAFAIVALIVLFAVLRGGLRYLANFTQWARDLLDWLRDFWARLFGGAPVQAKAAAKAAEASGGVEEEDRPFAWYRNPWGDGTAGQRLLRELIRYTFAALQAWAAERGVMREVGETPLEFAARVGDEAPALAEDVARFVDLYIRAEYADGKLPSASTEEVRQFWDRLEQATEAPLSA